MKFFKPTCAIALLLCLMLLTSCSTPVQQSNVAAPSSQPGASKSAVTPTPQPALQGTKPQNGDFTIAIEDTQQITDEMGLIWNYQLSMTASKTGGGDVLGNYAGEMVLTMEPDFESAQILAQKEGAELLSMLFKHHAEAENTAFELIQFSPEAYAELMKNNIPDNPLLQLSAPNTTTESFAVSRVTFHATQEPINMTVRDDSGTGSGTIPGRQVTVEVPMEIGVEGSRVTCFIYETVHPLSRAFYGTISK